MHLHCHSFVSTISLSLAVELATALVAGYGSRRQRDVLNTVGCVRGITGVLRASFVLFNGRLRSGEGWIGPTACSYIEGRTYPLTNTICTCCALPPSSITNQPTYQLNSISRFKRYLVASKLLPILSLLFQILLLPHQNTMSAITVQPLSFPEGSGIKFGAVVDNVNIENLTGKTR